MVQLCPWKLRNILFIAEKQHDCVVTNSSPHITGITALINKVHGISLEVFLRILFVLKTSFQHCFRNANCLPAADTSISNVDQKKAFI